MDTIAAIATPPGRGGIGIIRLSGDKKTIQFIAEQIAGGLPSPRQAVYRSFLDEKGQSMDQGILIYFAAPHSFTGEHVLELQAHGGIVLMDMLLERCLQLGARLARPGEFSERAFLNDRLNLTQAEAIADLIDAGTRTAVRLANRSLQGHFSKRIDQLLAKLIQIRVWVEAHIDFTDESIDPLNFDWVQSELAAIQKNIDNILEKARQGRIIREGIQLVIAGRPNVGKSSLLNALSQNETAIVTEIPGTTRDILQESIHIDGVPIHLLDTAGLRKSNDPIEKEGIKRAKQAMQNADCILWLYDAVQDPNNAYFLQAELPEDRPVLILKNKIDQTGETPSHRGNQIALSAKTGAGLELLKQALLNQLGLNIDQAEFLARRRHLDALNKTRQFIMQAYQQDALELLAEELRQAQLALSEITGQWTTDDLLGEIFSHFCIGK